MFKKCGTCDFELEPAKRCAAKGCIVDGKVKLSAWAPKQERSCENCRHEKVKWSREPCSACHGTRTGFISWAPKHERTCPPCAECVHDFERKFEPFKVTVEVTAESHGKWLLHKMDGVGLISEAARSQLKAHGIK